MTVSINGTNGLVFNDASTQNTSAFTGGFAFRNRIINGAMVIAQRGTSTFTQSTNNQYGLDRFDCTGTVSSKVSFVQSSVAPSGFINSTLITSLSAYSVLTGDFFVYRQRIEGLNCSDLGWGAAGAATVTISFWVRSSLTGSFGGYLGNGSLNRSYPFSYTINAANTWEQKTVTIAGDTTGTWLTTNGSGIEVGFSLGAGSTYSGTANTWAGSFYVQPTSSTNLVGTSGATFYITGVQLEKGSTATSFDYRPIGTELQLAQRYYYRQSTSGANGNYTMFGWGNAYGTGTINLSVTFPVSMRSYPSSIDTSAMATFQYETGNSSGNTPTSIAINSNNNSTWQCTIDVNKSAAFTNGAMYKLQAFNNTTAYIGFGAEL